MSDYLSLISKYESGNRNVMNYIGDSTHTAQGFFQLTNTNWRNLAPGLGVDLNQYPTAMTAPYGVQAQVANQLLNGSQPGAGIQNWADYNPALKGALQSQGLQTSGVVGSPASGSDSQLADATGGASGPLAGTANSDGTYVDANGNYHVPGVPDLTVGGPSGTGSNTPMNPTGGATAANPADGSSNVPTGSLSATSSTGTPVNITDLSFAGEAGANTLSTAAKASATTVKTGLTSSADTLAKQAAATTAQSIAAGTSWTAGIESTLTDLTVRGGLILLALVILVGAWIFYGVDAREGAHA